MTKREVNGNVLYFDFRGQQYVKNWGDASVAFFSYYSAELYKFNIISENNLIFGWMPKEGFPALDPDVLLEICKSEQNILAVMESENACLKYYAKYLPPQSLVLFLRGHLRLLVTDALEISCEDEINLSSFSVT